MKKAISLLVALALIIPANASFRKSRSWGGQKPPAGSVVDFNHPLARGLAAFWIMNEGGGNGIKDIVGTQDMTIGINTLTWSQGKNGPAMRSVANAGSTRGATFSGLTLATNFTIEFMVLVTSSSDSYGTVFINSGGVAGIWIFNSGGNYYPDFYNGIDNHTTNPLVLNKFTHVVLSVKNGVGTWYLNGQANGTVGTGTTITYSTSFNDPVSETLDGRIEYIRTWSNRALTQSEVQSLYSDPYGMMLSPRIDLRQQPAGAAPPITTKTWGFSF